MIDPDAPAIVGDLDPRLQGRTLEIYLPDLSGGGTERLHIGLAPYFQQAGMTVSFLLNKAQGDLLGTTRVPIVSLGTDRQITGFPRLVRHLKARRPDFLIANMEHMNLTALLANKVAGAGARVFVSQHNTLSKQAAKPGAKHRSLPWLYRIALPAAAGIIAVSKGVADDLSTTTGLRRDAVSVIYNGVVTEDFDARALEPAPFSWVDLPGPLVVAVGRMVAQKDYPTLLKAFAIVAARSPARLAILGDGPLRGDLERMVQALRLEHRVVMPGFVPNVLSVMARARLLTLSSDFEGFGLVIAEALACGLPVVSTDCPHGPAEILADGAFGTLTPVGDPGALAEAILATLDRPVDRDALIKRGRHFTMAHCAAQYLELFRKSLTGRGSAQVAMEPSS